MSYESYAGQAGERMTRPAAFGLAAALALSACSGESEASHENKVVPSATAGKLACAPGLRLELDKLPDASDEQSRIEQMDAVAKEVVCGVLEDLSTKSPVVYGLDGLPGATGTDYHFGVRPAKDAMVATSPDLAFDPPSGKLIASYTGKASGGPAPKVQAILSYPKGEPSIDPAVTADDFERIIANLASADFDSVGYNSRNNKVGSFFGRDEDGLVRTPTVNGSLDPSRSYHEDLQGMVEVLDGLR